jgi:plasmid stabilization system protein ParE
LVQVVWTRGAAAELRIIRAYVTQFSPLAARRLSQRLIAAARSLEKTPDRGRPIGGGRRELVVIRPYLIKYVHQDDRVIILEVRHGAQEQT